jgi:hypothetical protein
MGQQQLLLIILGVIIVGIAIAVGLSLFSAQSVQANKDAMINDLNNIAASAYQFRVRPISMGGGGGSFSPTGGTAYKIPSKMASNDNAGYTATPSADAVVVSAKSSTNAAGTIDVTVTSEGKLINWAYGTDFQ